MATRRRISLLGLAMWTLGGSLACSHVRYLYTAPHYAEQPEHTVKRLVVASWAPASQPGLGAVLTHLTADLVKLRKNYLVTQRLSEATSTEALCAKGSEAVLWVRSLGEASPPGAPRVHLRLALELVRCRDGMLIYRSEGEANGRPDDRALSEVTRSYATQLGDNSAPFVAPAFIILQQLIEPLYDPTLSEAEIEEKIELGFGAFLPSAPRT